MGDTIVPSADESAAHLDCWGCALSAQRSCVYRLTERSKPIGGQMVRRFTGMLQHSNGGTWSEAVNVGPCREEAHYGRMGGTRGKKPSPGREIGDGF